MKQRFALTLISVFLSLLGGKSAGANLDETALSILKGSIEYQSDKYSLETLSKSLQSENNLPDPEISGEYLFAPGEEPDRWGAEISWGVEWPGVYGARNKEAASKMTAAQKALYLKRVDKLVVIKKLLLDYILCQQRISLLEELNQNNDSIFKLAEKSARDGEMTTLDLNKIRIEYANIKAAKAILIEESATIENDISAIYGGDCSAMLKAMDCKFPEISIPSSSQLEGLGSRSAYSASMQAEVESARQSKEVMKMERLPSLSVGYKHAYEDRVHFNGPTLGVSIPLFSSRGKQKAAQAAIAEAEFKVEAAEKSVESEAGQQLKKLILIKGQLDDIEPILKNADHNATLLKAYKGGVITVVEYLVERNYFTNASSELLTLRHAAAVTQTELMKYLTEIDF